MRTRALEFYSGIGGLHQALSRACLDADAQVIEAFDWDPTATQVYSENYTNPIRKIDIGALTVASLLPLNADLWLLSPACQPYTVLNSNAQGAADPRARSFLHLVENVLPELAAQDAHPSYLLIENVAGFESSSTRQILLATLKTLRYNTLELLLTPLQFGIPNSRLRYYLLAKKAPLVFGNVPSDASTSVLRHIPGTQVNWSDPRSSGTETENRDDLEKYGVRRIQDYLDSDLETVRFWVPEEVLEKHGRLFDIVKPSSRRTCCFTRGYYRLVERAGSILQENEEIDTAAVFDTFLAAQARADPDAINVLRPLRLRYFSPSELLRIFAFDPHTASMAPHSLTWPTSISNKSKFKLIGNSVNVKVVQELIEYLFQ